MKTDTYLNGCHNREHHAQIVEVQDGWTRNGSRAMKFMANRMARDCQYTLTELGKVDKGCTGCKWKNGK